MSTRSALRLRASRLACRTRRAAGWPSLLVAFGCVLSAACVPESGLTVEQLEDLLGTEVRAVDGQPNQFVVTGLRGNVDLGRIGEIHTDLGYSVGVTLRDGSQAGLRFDAPISILPELLSRALGVEIESVPGDPTQFRLYAAPHTVRFDQIGRVDADLGYAVSVTLRDGRPIGFRVEPPRLDPRRYEALLGVRVERIFGEASQLRVFASPGSVDFARIGTVHTDLGYAVGVVLADGSQIGFQLAPDPPATPSAPELPADARRVSAVPR